MHETYACSNKPVRNLYRTLADEKGDHEGSVPEITRISLSSVASERKNSWCLTKYVAPNLYAYATAVGEKALCGGHHR